MNTDKWWPPQMGNFRYPSFVYWLLDNLPLLYEDKYPPEPSPIITGGHSQQANFLTPVEMRVELTTRCAACGRDGTMVLAHYRYGVPIADLARLSGFKEFIIESRIHCVVRYAASGACCRWIDTEKRKGESYESWCQRK